MLVDNNNNKKKIPTTTDIILICNKTNTVCIAIYYKSINIL